MPFLPIKQVDLRASDLESGVRVTCDVGYLCVTFGRLRPDVRDRQTDKRQTSDRHRRQTASSLNVPAY